LNTARPTTSKLVVRRLVDPWIWAACVVGCGGVSSPTLGRPVGQADDPSPGARVASEKSPKLAGATPPSATEPKLAPEAVASYERAAATSDATERRALLERAFEQFETAIGERARLSFSGGLERSAEALGHGSNGELVAVGRGVILRVAPSDLWRTTNFEIPPPSSFLAQRTALSRDATLGAYADRDNDRAIITIFDTRTGHRKRALFHPTGYVKALAFSGDGARLASGAGGRATLWDVATGAPGLEFSAGGYGFAFSHDGRSLASGEDLTVRIRNSATGAVLHELGPHTSGVEALAYSPDDAILYAGDNAGWLRIWDARSGKLLRMLRPHNDVVRGVVPLADNLRFATASREGTALLWHRTRDDALAAFPRQSAGISSFALSRDERKLASADMVGSLRVSDMASGRELRRIGHRVVPATALTFPSNDELVVATEAGVRRVVLTSGTWTGARGLPERVTALGRAADGHLLAITPEFVFHRYARKADGYTRGAAIALPNGQRRHFFSKPPHHPRVAEQAGEIVAALAGHEVFVWTRGGEALAFRKPGHDAFELGLASNGSAVAVAFPDHVELVSVPSGTVLTRVTAPSSLRLSRFTAFALSSNARELVIADSTSSLVVYDRDGKETLRRNLKAPASHLVSSKRAPGTFWAALADGSLALLEPHSNRASYFTAPSPSRNATRAEEFAMVPTALAVSPDERFIAIGYVCRARMGTALEGVATVRLWSFDGQRAEAVATLTETDAAEGALVSLDGASFDAAFGDPSTTSRLLRCTVGTYSLPLEVCGARHSLPGLLAKRLERLRKR
jgi:hypothetical protein